METAWSIETRNGPNACAPGALTLALGDTKRFADSPPDDLRVLAVGEGLVHRASAESGQDMILGHAVGVDIAELRPHLRPEFSQPHPRQASRAGAPNNEQPVSGEIL